MEKKNISQIDRNIASLTDLRGYCYSAPAQFIDFLMSVEVVHSDLFCSGKQWGIDLQNFYSHICHIEQCYDEIEYWLTLAHMKLWGEGRDKSKVVVNHPSWVPYLTAETYQYSSFSKYAKEINWLSYCVLESIFPFLPSAIDPQWKIPFPEQLEDKDYRSLFNSLKIEKIPDTINDEMLHYYLDQEICKAIELCSNGPDSNELGKLSNFFRRSDCSTPSKASLNKKAGKRYRTPKCPRCGSKVTASKKLTETKTRYLSCNNKSCNYCETVAWEPWEIRAFEE